MLFFTISNLTKSHPATLFSLGCLSWTKTSPLPHVMTTSVNLKSDKRDYTSGILIACYASPHHCTTIKLSQEVLAAGGPSVWKDAILICLPLFLLVKLHQCWQIPSYNLKPRPIKHLPIVVVYLVLISAIPDKCPVTLCWHPHHCS